MLDQLYRCVICPIFWVETLADLSKADGSRTPEKLVAGLAERTPVCHSAVNSSHWEAAQQALEGRQVPMDGRPMISGGRYVRVAGKEGVVFQNSPEQEAFSRWQQGRFEEVERVFARRWRDQLKALDLTVLSEGMRGALKKEDRPRSMQEARELARRVTHAGGNNYRQLQIALAIMDAPEQAMRGVIRLWKRRGSPPLREYAPYILFCLEVDLFFQLCLSNGLISDQRPSNMVDLSYLYYLPFTQGFASNDKLHRAMVPLFLRDDQFFCWGPDLKADLRHLDEHFWSLPEEQKAGGLFLLASSPPLADEGVIAQHWDKSMPGWRNRKPVPPPPKDSEASKRILGESQAFIGAAEAGKLAHPTRADPDALIIERHIPRQRGKWRMFSSEAEAADDAEQARRR